MEIPYEDGGMYIILQPLSQNRWHWGIFLMLSHPWGQLYTVADSGPPSGPKRWHLDEYLAESIPGSPYITAALQIAVGIDEDNSEAVHEILANIPVPENDGHCEKWNGEFSDRLWVMEAVEQLGDRGLAPNLSAEQIENEATAIGMAAEKAGERMLGISRAVDGWR
jgi:hypothetical protein